MKPGSTLATTLPSEIVECLKRALAEDIGPGDVTTNSIVPANAILRGRILAKDAGIVAGLDLARGVFLLLEDQISFVPGVAEGAQVTNGTVLANISGSARALLTGERTALNFLGRMSGIATLTRQFVDKVSGTSARILDTRKTAPGLRAIDKLAVRRGGGENHRMGLFDMVLIKDNHIDFAGSIAAAIERVRAATAPSGLPAWGPRTGAGLEIEVEARTLEHVKESLGLGVERILLDNMTPDVVREAVALNGGRAKLEASGNITLENVRQIAETGVDFISVGSLTHSAKVFDVSLKWTG
ncbi:MAG: carboxylating nicotinate-nucleotide diphosphorylase [Pyrinomonadaceae bacterium]|nr:carboxylating nicotinate-nucleotide diphosphorylase [Pyrinomonadaceae bacterium]